MEQNIRQILIDLRNIFGSKDILHFTKDLYYIAMVEPRFTVDTIKFVSAFRELSVRLKDCEFDRLIEKAIEVCNNIDLSIVFGELKNLKEKLPCVKEF